MNRRASPYVFLLAWLLPAAPLPAVQGLPHQAEPFEGLYVSGQPSKAQLGELAAQGFTTIINLRPEGEFDDFDEAAEVQGLGMTYVHIPVRNVASIDADDAAALHQAVENAPGTVLLHCTIGWRAGSLLAIERYLLHGASRDEALEIATAAHMEHAADDVGDWIRAHP